MFVVDDLRLVAFHFRRFYDTSRKQRGHRQKSEEKQLSDPYRFQIHHVLAGQKSP